MTLSLEERTQVWLQAWQSAGIEMEQVKREELRNLDPEADRIAIDALFDFAIQLGGETDSSGIIETRRILDSVRP